MLIKPSPITAGLAGAFSASALPLVRAWLGAESGLSISFGIALLLVVALPAHALVIGFSRAADADTKVQDKALLVRIGTWLAAAALAFALRFVLV